MFQRELRHENFLAYNLAECKCCNNPRFTRPIFQSVKITILKRHQHDFMPGFIWLILLEISKVSATLVCRFKKYANMPVSLGVFDLKIGQLLQIMHGILGVKLQCTHIVPAAWKHDSFPDSRRKRCGENTLM